jgi:uncharacterized membrane protein
MHRLRAATQTIRSALWFVPFIAILLELVATRLVHQLDLQLGWNLLGLGASGARAVLDATVTMTLSFLVFTFGSLLVAIQVAGGQLTPRIIATMLLRDNVVRYTVGLFVFAMMFAISALNRIETQVNQLVLLLAGGLAVTSMAAFLYLIDYAARLLRPISILTRIADRGLTVIEQLYPAPALADDGLPAANPRLGAPGRIVLHAESSQVLLAIELPDLIAAARAAGGIVELIPSVGDFVAKDEPLFALHGTAAAIGDAALHDAVLFGPERTMEQDPAFAFRIVVDIALKALSPAINDPTTAVLAIDQLHRLLRQVGKRHLSDETLRDDAGEPRVIFRTPNWEDYVNLAFSEIRVCGANNFQVARRLRAMIENLTGTLPAHRHAALQQQLALLDCEIDAQYRWPEDVALARGADSQGLGGTKS